MAVPKRKSSKSKQRSRRRSHKTSLHALNPCPNCGVSRRPHRVCPECGYYRGKQTVKIPEKREKDANSG